MTTTIKIQYDDNIVLTFEEEMDGDVDDDGRMISWPTLNVVSISGIVIAPTDDHEDVMAEWVQTNIGSEDDVYDYIRNNPSKVQTSSEITLHYVEDLRNTSSDDSIPW